MKKLWALMVLVICLSGCSQPEDYETLMDSNVPQARPEKMEIVVALPGEAAKTVMASDNGEQLYICDDYTMSLRTVASGDLYKTVMDISGFSPEQLPILETVQGNAKRYAFVWTAAGENGDQIGRCAILDDGNYHYIVTTMAEASKTGELTEGAWREIFNSFRILPAEEVVSSGS